MIILGFFEENKQASKTYQLAIFIESTYMRRYKYEYFISILGSSPILDKLWMEV